MALIVTKITVENGHKYWKTFRSPKVFRTEEELEKERKRLKAYYKADHISFTPVIDIGDCELTDEVKENLKDYGDIKETN